LTRVDEILDAPKALNGRKKEALSLITPMWYEIEITIYQLYHQNS